MAKLNHERPALRYKNNARKIHTLLAGMAPLPIKPKKTATKRPRVIKRPALHRLTHEETEAILALLHSVIAHGEAVSEWARNIKKKKKPPASYDKSFEAIRVSIRQIILLGIERAFEKRGKAKSPLTDFIDYFLKMNRDSAIDFDGMFHAEMDNIRKDLRHFIG